MRSGDRRFERDLCAIVIDHVTPNLKMKGKPTPETMQDSRGSSEFVPEEDRHGRQRTRTTEGEKKTLSSASKDAA